ncbi:MAG: hypothetical protein ACHRXM_13670 [Isosphaerales bacterium]
MVKKPMERVSVNKAEQLVFNWREFDPAMLNGKEDLLAELTSYRDNLDTLLRDRGKYVVIKGSEIIGVYRAHSSAMKVALRFAPGPVLVKKIVEKEPAREIGHIVP